MIKKVLFTGDYDKDYNRTTVISIGLESIGINVIHFPFKKHKKNVKEELKKLSEDVDLIFLPSFTHLDVRFVKKTTNKAILFDPLISKYLTKVFDFKQVSKYSPRAYKNYLKDKIAFNNSDIILADTEEHKKYFTSKFNIPEDKIEILRIGVDCNDFYPTENKNDKYIVGFYGGFIPLQGVKNIVNAAKILLSETDIVFRLIGTGFEYEIIKKMIAEDNLTNIELPGWLNYKDLPAAINKFDVCLGIFGNTPKADIVIPNKVYHYAACNKPIITKNTAGINEIFTNNENIILCSSTPEDIANSIIETKKNISKSAEIAKSAYKLISENYNTKSIANKFIEIAQKLV